MNCPHHIQIYASRPRSYRELPIRYMENTIQYRDEKKGELAGLSRVRSISIDDAHIFCRLEEIEPEFTKIMEMIKELYSTFKMDFRARLSFRDDSEGYLGSKEVWSRAQKIIEDVAKKLQLDYFIAEGDAAFYGPKIDILIKDSLGREHQLATEQLDFVMPERFGLKYIDSDGTEKPVVMIHKALLGSFERFLAVYLEHTNGNFPLWLAPEQLRIATLNDDKGVIHKTYEIMDKAKELGLRVELDNSNESVGKKIREAELMKVPYTVVIGPKEVESGKLAPRSRHDLPELPESSVDELLQRLADDAKSRK
jgi:threonyl-tRNA synthetase